MSNKKIANRMHDILMQKAVMGMGFSAGAKRNKTRNFHAGELEDIMEIYGRGQLAAGASKKKKKKVSNKRTISKNPWVQWIKEYAELNNMTYAAALSDPTAQKMYCESLETLFPQKYKTGVCNKNKSKNKTTKRKKCPKGTTRQPVRSYTRKNGSKVEAMIRCRKTKTR